MRRTLTQRTTVAAAIAGLALFGAACDDGVEEEVGDVGDEIEQEVDEGVDGDDGDDG